MNKSKAKGTRAETNLVKYLESAGLEAFRQALHGSLDQGDVLLRMYDGNICTEEIVFEVKTGKQTASVSRKVKEEWLKQTRTEMHNAKVRKAYLVIAKWQTGINDWEVWSADGHSFWYLNHFVNYIKTHGKKGVDSAEAVMESVSSKKSVIKKRCLACMAKPSSSIPIGIIPCCMVMENINLSFYTY